MDKQEALSRLRAGRRALIATVMMVALTGPDPVAVGEAAMGWYLACYLPFLFLAGTILLLSPPSRMVAPNLLVLLFYWGVRPYMLLVAGCAIGFFTHVDVLASDYRVLDPVHLYEAAHPTTLVVRGGVGLGVTFALLSVAHFLHSLGFVPGLVGHTREEEGKEFMWLMSDLWSYMGGIAAGAMSGTRIAAPLIAFWTAGLVWVLFALLLTARIARKTLARAGKARGFTPETPCTSALFVHCSDVHLTTSGNPRAEGGVGGNDRLARLVPRTIELGSAYLLMTGDSVDAGSAEEWSLAHDILLPLTSRGIPVIVAPGNHDLVPVYVWHRQADYLWRWLRGENSTWMHGFQLHAYLSAAADLAPELKAANGRTLSSVIEEQKRLCKKTWTRLERRHDEAVRLDMLDRKRFDTMARRLQAVAPPYWDHVNWHSALSSCAWADVRERIEYEGLVRQWEELFPLSYYSLETGTVVCVLNSVSNEFQLLNSAWGHVGPEQLARLQDLVNRTPAKRVVIAMHHAPFRWWDERIGVGVGESWRLVERWAALAMGRVSAKGLHDVLIGAVRSGKDVVVCCGHRHGGKEHASRVGVWGGIRVSEAASLADEDALVVGANWGARGRTVFRRVMGDPR